MGPEESGPVHREDIPSPPDGLPEMAPQHVMEQGIRRLGVLEERRQIVPRRPVLAGQGSALPQIEDPHHVKRVEAGERDVRDDGEHRQARRQDPHQRQHRVLG